MTRGARKAMHELVLPALAVLVSLHLDRKPRDTREAAHQQPLDLDNEIERLIRIDPEVRQPRRNAQPDVGADGRHVLAPATRSGVH